jgi:Flp pilus assembly pilin Flp
VLHYELRDSLLRQEGHYRGPIIFDLGRVAGISLGMAWISQSLSISIAKLARQSYQRKCPGPRLGNSTVEATQMNNIFLNLLVLSRALKDSEEGQDMVEYALVVCLLSLAATTAISGVGTAVVNLYSNISTGIV